MVKLTSRLVESALLNLNPKCLLVTVTDHMILVVLKLIHHTIIELSLILQYSYMQLLEVKVWRHFWLERVAEMTEAILGASNFHTVFST